MTFSICLSLHLIIYRLMQLLGLFMRVYYEAQKAYKQPNEDKGVV